MTASTRNWADSVDGEHRDALFRAINNTLSTDAALTTYAQIIDGLPLGQIAREMMRGRLHGQHPIYDHEKLCPGVSDKFREVRATFDVFATLQFEPEVGLGPTISHRAPPDIDHQQLLARFQSAHPSSSRFTLRLIELVARALHQVAVDLFQLNLSLHDPAATRGLSIGETTSWEREPDEWARIEPWPTMFAHPFFLAQEQYPNGIADMAGYWAEDRILGGVALFDHSQEDWEESDEPNAYFHSGRDSATFRIWQLLDEQKDNLVEFWLRCPTSDNKVDCPLPILPSNRNTRRIDIRDAIPVYKVYRDLWERRPPKPLLRMQQLAEPCVVSPRDYSEIEDVSDQIRRLDRMWHDHEKSSSNKRGA